MWHDIGSFISPILAFIVDSFIFIFTSIPGVVEFLANFIIVLAAAVFIYVTFFDTKGATKSISRAWIEVQIHKIKEIIERIKTLG